MYLTFTFGIAPAYQHVADNSNDGTRILVLGEIEVNSVERVRMFVVTANESKLKSWRHFTRVLLRIASPPAAGGTAGSVGCI